MKNNLEIFEFEPNQIITFDKLAAAGITKEDIHAFCDDVADYVEDGSYFSIQSIKKNGFESELFDLGFSDWFYANLLTADTRFSYTKAFGNIILYKGNERITIQSFEEELIKEQGSIDVYDLMTEMEEVYGCKIPERLDLIYKVGETDVYYDKYLDRLYANSDIFNRELDAVGEMV
jgi:acyl carrier protein